MRRILAAVPVAAALLLAREGRTDICLLNMWDAGTVQGGFVFPNWEKVHVGSFSMVLCDSLTCNWRTDERITGVTVFNYGTAGTADIKAVYWQGACGATFTPLYPLTYKGVYPSDSGPHGAWTWAGSSVDFAACAESCLNCGGIINIDLYADITSCPSEGAQVKLGFGTNYAANTVWYGSVKDNAGCAAPWGDITGPPNTIVYALKRGPDWAAPGDTVTYTIYYGRPGTGSLSGVNVLDSMPAYTHYVPGSAVPNPDAFWDPNLGPPTKLKWTMPGGPTAGGPTSAVVFSLTVDWGNGELFEAGSGNLAAPEGQRLDNRAHITFSGISGCGMGSVTTPPVTTVVRRFLSWMEGDNDLVFAPSIGMPPDEIIYSVFIKNTSSDLTWRDVVVWDTVPVQLDTWCADCGLEDPCAGWTMTPTGCAFGGAGRFLSGSNTVLTWRFDMPPAMTITLRWKAKVFPTAYDGLNLVNQSAILANGRTGIVGGTGSSRIPSRFTHLAPVILRTTYVSYVGFAAAAGDSPCVGFLMSFFPPHKSTQFELRGIQYQGAGWSTGGGVSDSIGCSVGDCIGGFPGNTGCILGSGVVPGGGIAGCKAERIPATYDPPYWTTTCPVYPANFIYKLTSNSPVVWQLLTHLTRYDQDNQTNAPSHDDDLLRFHALPLEAHRPGRYGSEAVGLRRLACSHQYSGGRIRRVRPVPPDDRAPV